MNRFAAVVPRIGANPPLSRRWRGDHVESGAGSLRGTDMPCLAGLAGPIFVDVSGLFLRAWV